MRGDKIGTVREPKGMLAKGKQEVNRKSKTEN